MTKNELGRELAAIFEEFYPWEFYDVWASSAQCARESIKELEANPRGVLESLDDLLENLEKDDALYKRIISAQDEIMDRYGLVKTTINLDQFGALLGIPVVHL